MGVGIRIKAMKRNSPRSRSQTFLNVPLVGVLWGSCIVLLCPLGPNIWHRQDVTEHGDVTITETTEAPTHPQSVKDQTRTNVLVRV